MRNRLLFFLLLVAFAPFAAAQQSPCDTGEPPSEQRAPRVNQAPPNYGAAPAEPLPPDLARKQLAQRNKERQASLKNDSQKLLQLATELKQQVDKTNEHVLSLDVIRKAEEIEKLAKSVRDKMKAGGYCDFPGE